MSHVTCEGVTSRVTESDDICMRHVTCHMWMNHTTRVWVMSRGARFKFVLLITAERSCSAVTHLHNSSALLCSNSSWSLCSNSSWSLCSNSSWSLCSNSSWSLCSALDNSSDRSQEQSRWVDRWTAERSRWVVKSKARWSWSLQSKQDLEYCSVPIFLILIVPW